MFQLVPPSEAHFFEDRLELLVVVFLFSTNYVQGLGVTKHPLPVEGRRQVAGDVGGRPIALDNQRRRQLVGVQVDDLGTPAGLEQVFVL